MPNLDDMSDADYEAHAQKQLEPHFDLIGKKITKAGINRGSVAYLENIAKYFSKLEARKGDINYNERDLLKLGTLANANIKKLKTKKVRGRELTTLSKRQFKSAVTTVFSGVYGWNDPGMIQMFLRDTADHINLAVKLAAGKATFHDAWDMDTASRDEIPASVYNYLADDGGDNDY